MQVNITARHLELNNDFRSHANEKLQKLERYTSRIEEARAVIST